MGICITLHLRAWLFPQSIPKLVCFANRWYRHPVYQEYTPPMISSAGILLPEGAGKEWDEKLLVQWEYRANQGREWEGRSHRGQGREVDADGGGEKEV
jgi:hypothetical protein